MFSLSKLKSHPEKSLYAHLQKVGDLCFEGVSSKKLDIDDFIDFNILKKISYLIGVSHDFGKSTSYFQDYLNEQDEHKRRELRNKTNTHHSFISAIFAYYVIKSFLSEEKLLDNKYYRYLPILSYLVVKRHHGNLGNALDEILDFDQNNEETFTEQINAINFDEVNSIYNALFSKKNFDYDCCQFRQNILKSEEIYIYGKLDRCERYFTRDISYREKKLINNLDEENTLFYYSIAMLLYSVLLDADKIDAADLNITERVDISDDIIDKFIDENFKSNKDDKISFIRNAIYQEVTSVSVDLDKDKILSLNAPTGTGKTLTSLSFALKLRNKIEREKGYKPRIIYSLPFLSIIDQNYAVFEDVLRFAQNGNKPGSDLLLKHHHLSDAIYSLTNSDTKEFESVYEQDINRDLLLIEGWNSEIVVTTFIQFFHSLVSNRNKAVRKFHNIVNSIVILDEVQAIPHRYWLLLNKIMNFLAKHFNIYFLLLTATQPLLFNEEEKEIKSLVKNKIDYFSALNRVELILNLETICLNDFKNILKKDFIKNPAKNFLIVLNTVNSAQEIFNFVKELSFKNTDYCFLSSEITPKDRLARIRKIKKDALKRKIIVSTQLIEAGVDLDVDIVYRDFAPLDSINQVAGRCNRNYRQEKGTIKIFILKQEEDKKEYHRYIYDSYIIEKTKDIFREFNQDKIAEKDFLNLSNLYFDRVNQGKSNDVSNALLEDVKKLNFNEISKFKLIEEHYRKIDIFVETDDTARDIYRKYQGITEIKNYFTRKKEFLKIRKRFYDYVISVPYQYGSGFIDIKESIVDDFPKISKEEISQGHYYDIQTGFIRDGSSSKGGSLIF